MARATWPLLLGRPRVQIGVSAASTGEQSARDLVADSGAGALNSPFELILSEHDCVWCGGYLIKTVRLGGAYSGFYPLYWVRIQVTQLGFDEELQVVGVPSAPSGFDGLAGFRFMNRFNYGNFGDPAQFGLETLPNGI